MKIAQELYEVIVNSIDKHCLSLSQHVLYSIKCNPARGRGSMTKALAIRTDTALSATDHDPIGRWDAAVTHYLETCKGGPEGNTAKTYRHTAARP